MRLGPFTVIDIVDLYPEIGTIPSLLCGHGKGTYAIIKLFVLEQMLLKLSFDEQVSWHFSLAVYCGLSTASEVFLISTTQLYSCQCNYDTTIPYIDKREELQQEYSQPPILPSPHFRWVVNTPVPSAPLTLPPPPPAAALTLPTGVRAPGGALVGR